MERIVSLVGLQAGARVLDLCCGVGRHSLEFARRGFCVTAVDKTRAFLARAGSDAEAAGLEVAFVHDDMRAFCQPDTFDVAVNLLTSFGYFEDPEDDRRVVRNVYNSLKSGGVFVIELMGKEVLARVFQERDWNEHDGMLMLAERRVSRNWSWLENRWITIKGHTRTELRYSHRIYSAAELVSLLTGCGFSRVDVAGDLSGSPYDHTSKRLVVVGRR
ncbi:MAG: class I SAM-dependent methyltransferase [Chloroflexi bacterium]|nr:class I SAM-dependent methyltransferase [Chloroflexota bacterium]